jgi:hypothetical protein
LAGGEGSLSFDYASKTTDIQSYDIKQSTTSSIPRNGPGQDGINHDEDAIYLLLKPKINLSLSSSAIEWTFGDNSQSHIQYVSVGELNGHLPWRAGVLAQLHGAGITPADYPNILASDPLANGAATLDPARFVPMNTMFPYEPPLTPNDPVIPINTTISSSTTSTTGTATEDTYKVGLTLSGSAGFLGMEKGTFKASDTWAWTNSSSASTSSGSTQSASLTIGGPSFGYTGVTEVAVYRDTVYNTFAFVLVPPDTLEVALRGTVLNSSRAAAPATGEGVTSCPRAAGCEVILTDNGIDHRTFTNSLGQYVFYGHLFGPATIKAGNVTQTIPQVQNAPNLDLHVIPAAPAPVPAPAPAPEPKPATPEPPLYVHVTPLGTTYNHVPAD